MTSGGKTSIYWPRHRPYYAVVTERLITVLIPNIQQYIVPQPSHFTPLTIPCPKLIPTHNSPIWMGHWTSSLQPDHFRQKEDHIKNGFVNTKHTSYFFLIIHKWIGGRFYRHLNLFLLFCVCVLYQEKVRKNVQIKRMMKLKTSGEYLYVEGEGDGCLWPPWPRCNEKVASLRRSDKIRRLWWTLRLLSISTITS